MKETDKQNQHQGNYTYIVKCSDETLYTGWTNNLKKRLEAHNSGKGAKYTKNRRPVDIPQYSISRFFFPDFTGKIKSKKA